MASSPAVPIQGVSLIPQANPSLTEGWLAEQEMLSPRMPMNHFEAESRRVLNQLYITDRQADIRIPVFRKNPPDPEWAFY